MLNICFYTTKDCEQWLLIFIYILFSAVGSLWIIEILYICSVLRSWQNQSINYTYDYEKNIQQIFLQKINCIS